MKQLIETTSRTTGFCPKLPLIAALACGSCLPLARGEADWMFPRSSVVNLASFGQNYEEYENFGINLVAWGADPAYVSDSWLQGQMAAARATGHLYYFSTNADVVTATAKVLFNQPALQDAVLRDLDFEPILVPWFSTRTFNGVPTWAACTNHPLYQEHLEDKLRHGLNVGADALHLDTPEGSNRLGWGGCFCDYCITAFRPFLEQHASPEELSELGPIESFNYRTYLRGLYTPAAFVTAYSSNAGSIPLIGHYERFQEEAFAALVEQMHATLESEFEALIPLSVNVYDLSPGSLDVAATADFLTAEVNYYGGATAQPKPWTRFALQLSTALGKRFCTTATGWDWGSVRDNDNMTVIKLWISLTYALGHHFVVPYNQWIISGGQQESQFYTPDPSETRPVYQYIHSKAGLLDEAEDAAEVALVIDLDAYAASSSGSSSEAFKLFQGLVNGGYAVQLVATSSGLFTSLLDSRVLPEADLILVSAGVDTGLDPELDQWISESVAAGAVLQQGLVLGDVSRLAHEPRQSIDGAQGIIFPRRMADTSVEHRVYHILNTEYDSITQSVTIQYDMQVRFRPADDFLLHNWIVRWHELGQDPVELPFSYTLENLEVAIPRLETWGMLEVIESGPPTERFPVLLTPLAGGVTASLEFPSTMGRHYRIMTSTDLGNWSQHGVDLPGTGDPIEHVVPIGDATFYQVLSAADSGVQPDLDYLTEYFDGTAGTTWFAAANTLDGYGPGNEAPKDVGTFTWGAYSAGATNDDNSKVIANSLWSSGGVLSIRFAALTPGTYAYTVFDGTGPYDASGEGAGIVLEQFNGVLNGGTTTFAVLLFDGTDWWQSDAATAVELSWGLTTLQEHAFRFSGPQAVGWRRLSNATDLAEMDAGGEQALVEEESGTPDFSQISGMGVRIVQNSAAAQLEFSRMELQY